MDLFLEEIYGEWGLLAQKHHHWEKNMEYNNIYQLPIDNFEKSTESKELTEEQKRWNELENKIFKLYFECEKVQKHINILKDHGIYVLYSDKNILKRV